MLENKTALIWRGVTSQENNQTAEGIKIPKILVPYCGFEMI